MKIYYNSILFKLPYIRQFDGLVLGKFCFIKDSKNDSIEQKALILHEAVHIEQMNRLGIFYFYFTYYIYFFVNFLKYKDAYKAYYYIPYEVEAYEISDNYLRKYKK